METVSSPASQPETYAHDDNPGFNEDPELVLIFEDGVFYQEGIDGVGVAITVDRPGPLPSSNVVGAPRASSQKRTITVAAPAPSTFIPSNKVHRSKRQNNTLAPQWNQPRRNPGPAIKQVPQDAAHAPVSSGASVSLSL